MRKYRFKSGIDATSQMDLSLHELARV